MPGGDLERFELSIEEAVYLRGEVLYDEGGVRDLKKGENNLFTVEVSDKDRIYEVEIQNPASLQRRATCECKYFMDVGSCEHIVASLLAIRKKLSRPKKLTKVQKSETFKPKFNARVIAETLSASEMKAFIIDYSRKDRKFDLFLKARFSKKIEMKDNSVKYKTIVDALIPPAKNSDYKVSKSSANQAIKFFDEFLIQIEDSLAMKQFKEAFEIYDPVFKKISYVRHYSRDQIDALEKLNLKYHKILLRILRTPAAPELIEEIKQYMLSVASFSYYSITDFSYNLLYMLYTHDQSYLDEISEIISSKKVSTFNPLRAALYFYFNRNKLNNESLSEWYDDQSTLIKSMEILIENNGEDTAKSILNIAHDLGWSNSGFDDLYLNIMKLDNNYEEFISYSITKLLDTQQYYFYKLMINKLEPDLYNMVYNAIDQVAKELDPDLLCKIYEYNRNHDALMETVNENDDIYLAMKYDHVLMDTHGNKIDAFYLKAIESYLKNHMGYEADQFINNILDHLRSRNNKRLIKNIRNMIQKKFPHRKRFLQLHISNKY